MRARSPAAIAWAGAAIWFAAAAAQAEPAAPTPPPPAEPTFDINAIDVDGNTLLDPATLEAAVYPSMGPKRTRSDVAKAQQALEDAYHAHGYQSVVVEVPRQTVAEGVVKLHVVETPIGRLRVVGSKYHTLDKILDGVPALSEGKVADFKQAQAELNEANRLPDRQVTPLIRAGQAPGTIDVDLKVSDEEPLHGSVELNNQHSAFTQPLRTSVNLRYDNLWQMGHSLSATYEVAPQRRKDGEVWAGSYVAPIWNTPFNVLVFGFNSNSDLATLGGVDVLGKGYDIGARAVYQFPSLGSISQSLSFGIDFKHFLELDRLSGGQVSTGAVDYWPLNATYTFRRQTTAITSATVALTAGVRGFGDDDEAFGNKRVNARASFVHLNLDLEHEQPLWAGFQLDARVSGQIANGALVSSEQFSIGGFSSVRGYLESEGIGDNGVSGSLEFRSPLLLRRFTGVIDDFRIFAFLDAGNAWVTFPQPEQKQVFTLTSSGVGARFQLFDHLSGDVSAAIPLRDGPNRQGHKAYTTFSLKAEF